MDTELINKFSEGVAVNGPWAIMAGYLLKRILDAWTGDRDQVTALLGEFKTTLSSVVATLGTVATTLDSLKTAFDHLSVRLEQEPSISK